MLKIFLLLSLFSIFVAKPIHGQQSNPEQLVVTVTTTATYTNSIEISVYQNGSYYFHFTKSDGSQYFGELDVSSKYGENSTYPDPSPYNDANGKLFVVHNGSLYIDLGQWRNKTNGKYIPTGKYYARFRPKGRIDIPLSNEVIVNVEPIDIARFWPLPQPGSYFEYKEISGVAPTRFRFDIEKNVNACDSTNITVFRMTQTNRRGTPRRFMGSDLPGSRPSAFRFMVEWIGNHLHGFGVKNYTPSAEDYSENPLTPRGKLGFFKAFWGMKKDGYTNDNLPSFYLIPKYLNLNLYQDGTFQGSSSVSGNACTDFGDRYKWAMDIRILDETDLNSGTGRGNLQTGDLQIRFIEHDTPGISPNREDWFLRENVGVIRIEKHAEPATMTEDCVVTQHANFACWSDPNLVYDSRCSCWARRIHQQNISDAFELVQVYAPQELSFVFKENQTSSVTLRRGGFYTLKETAVNYTGFLSELSSPQQIWKAYTDAAYNIGDVWLENGEAKIFVPPNFPAGVYRTKFRSWIWGKPQDDLTGNELEIPLTYPEWSNEITVTVLSNPGDLNTDGKINIFDYNLLVSDFDKTGVAGWIAADINSDGKVNIFDYNLMVRNYGR